MPAPPLPKFAAPRAPRADAPVVVVTPQQVTAVHMDTDIGVILNVAPQLAAEQAEPASDPLRCRKSEQLRGSHLSGPAVCLRQSEWGLLKAKGLELLPDGRSVAASYEKRRSVDNPGCPLPNIVGSATTGMSSTFSICY